MFYTIYKITNQVDGKFYIGSHKTKNLDDDYMGSGKYLNHAQKKHGVENFVKEILFVFDTAEEMYAKEAELVNEEFISEHNTYNVKIGGFGGWDYVNDNPEKFLTEKRLSSLMTPQERLKRWKEKWENDPEFREKHRDNAKLALLKSKEKYPNGTFAGRKHKQETIQKIKMSSLGVHKGELNSQYGTMWITNGVKSKKINKTDSIPEGWRKGRVM